MQLTAAPLEQLDERHRLPVERGVLGRRCRAEMGLQRHVPEILQRDDAVRVRVPEDRRNGQRHLRSSSATLAKESVSKSIGPGWSARTIDSASRRRMRK